MGKEIKPQVIISMEDYEMFTSKFKTDDILLTLGKIYSFLNGHVDRDNPLRVQSILDYIKENCPNIQFLHTGKINGYKSYTAIFKGASNENI